MRWCKPFLQSKRSKTFLDHWLLGDDLRRFTEPWAFAQLNLIEKMLLAQRLDGGERQAVARLVREALELRPIDRERLEALFDLALKSANLDQDKDDTAGRMRTALRPTAAAPSAGPTGPSTGGPTGPLGGGGERQYRGPGDNMPAPGAPPVRRFEAKDEENAPKSEMAAEESAPALRDSAEKNLAEDLSRRGIARQLYRAVEPTKLLVEHDYWHRRLEQTTPDVVAPNQFWLDYANAPAGTPFVVRRDRADRRLVPRDDDGARRARPAVRGRQARSHRRRRPAHAEGGDAAAAGAQGDHQGRARRRSAAAAARPELLPPRRPLSLRERRTPRRLRHRRVPRRRRLRLPGRRHQPHLQQAHHRRAAAGPGRRHAAAEGLLDQGRGVELEPYATQQIEYAFYFPAAGSFAHYPAHAAEKGKLAAHAQPRTLPSSRCRPRSTPRRGSTSRSRAVPR
jgi:hypothetical protein